jgi:hypothetical protein
MAPEAQCGINLGLVTEQGDTPKSLFPQKKEVLIMIELLGSPPSVINYGCPKL